MWTSVVLALALTGDVLSQTLRNPARKARYDSGEVHSSIMSRKHSTWNAKRKAGEFLSANYTTLAFTPCTDGRAGEFKCSNVDLYSFKSHAELGSQTGEGSSSWGWTHEGRDFAIVAQADGASFSEINAETGELEYLGRLPNTQGSEAIIWREIRVMGNIAVIGSEAVNHHIQFFDLTKLLDITAEERPKTFDSVQDVSLFKGLPTGRTHNVVANTELQYAVSVGAAPRSNTTVGGGLVFIDLKDPSNPTYLGAQAEDGYVHDAQCLVYRGPDTRFAGDDICYGYNEDTLTIYNVTDKAHATIISRTGYVGAAYTHQGWVLDPNDQSYLILDDEYDEVDAIGPAADGYPVTYIWDIRNLTAPVQTGYYKSSIKGIDHNQYILNGKSYQSNYGAGLRILDVSSIPTDPTGAGVKEIGFFDVFPEDDEAEGGGAIEFQGSWSSFPFPSERKWILINSIERGAYVVKYTGA